MTIRTPVLAVSVLALFGLGVGAGFGAGASSEQSADPVALRASLRAGAEVPKPTGVPARARGAFTASLTRRATGGTLAWRLTFSGLSGRAIAAHVHGARTGKAGPVIAALCGPCRSGVRGRATIKRSVVAAMLRGNTYVNVHTMRNKAGEIRGQVVRGGSGQQPPPVTPPPTDTTPTPPPTYPPYP